MCFFSFATSSMAVEYYVDNNAGDDAFSGTSKTVSENKVGPFRTILRAVKLAGAGDTVNLVPGDKPWREAVVLNTHPTWYHRGGEEGKPLIIDGHGSWISGADICPSKDWKKEDDGVWTHSGMAYSGFMVIEGRLENQVSDIDVTEPGELCYQGWANRLYYRVRDNRSPMPAIELGQPDGSTLSIEPKDWQYAGRPGFNRYCGSTPKPADIKPPTWVKIDGRESKLACARERLAPGKFTISDKKLYFRPPEGKRPGDMPIEAVVRENGVALGGSTSHVVIRNFNVRHVYNDGYNIHGGCKKIVFNNCNAEDCGDEGFSSHDNCETLLDGAVFLRCDNGLNNVNSSVSASRNVVIADCRSLGYEGQQQSRHEVENLILVDNPLSCVNFTGRNILIVNTGKRPVGIGLAGESSLDRLTVSGPSHDRLLHLYGASRVDISRSRFEDGGKGVVHIRHSDPGILRIKDSLFHPDTVVEWGAGQPFKRMKLADAAKDQALPFSGAGVIETPLLEALTRGERPAVIPKDSGCTAELIERYLEFMNKNKKGTSK
ncbi:MAG: right-handed parallel beta-helix repeat-containing protein [Victivallales bacterium]